MNYHKEPIERGLLTYFLERGKRPSLNMCKNISIQASGYTPCTQLVWVKVDKEATPRRGWPSLLKECVP